MEVRATDGTWRADVLACSHDSTRRIAWEAQLSPIKDEDTRDRTARYDAEGIGVCWVSPAQRVPWMSIVPSIRVRDPHDNRPWIVVDGVARFSYEHGTWITVDDLELTTFVRWVLHEQTTTHHVLPRYRRIWFGTDQGYARRQMTWTTYRSIGEEARHEAMRQRQEAWKRRQEEQQRLAEQRRKEEAEARRREEERQRKIREAAWQARWEEQQRQWAIEAEEARQRREAEERQQQQQDRAAEQERLRQEQREQQAACQWWDELSLAQVQQLRAAAADHLWKKEATRVEFDPQGRTVGNAHGIAIYLRRRVYGILRPSPASLHRLSRTLPVFVRNAREAQLIIDTGKITPDRVQHFDLPDGEQLSLI